MHIAVTELLYGEFFQVRYSSELSLAQVEHPRHPVSQYPSLCDIVHRPSAYSSLEDFSPLGVH